MTTTPAPASANRAVFVAGAAVTVIAFESTRTEPAGSVPVAVIVWAPDSVAGIVTLAERAPELSVVTVASRTGVDAILIWTEDPGAKPVPDTVTCDPGSALPVETASVPLGWYWARTAWGPRTIRSNAAEVTRNRLMGRNPFR